MKLYTAPELEAEDFLCIPGLDSVKMEIASVLTDPDGCWTIVMTTGVSLNLPNGDRKVWALKKKDV